MEVMLKEEEPVPVKVLAERVGSSKRTVQRELEFAATDVKPYGLTFHSKTGTGVWLEGTDEAKKTLLEQIKKERQSEIGSREERRKRLILEILKDKGLKKLFYYSDLFGVSEATISSDLEAVESWLGSQNLKILRKPGSGISIEGSEESYRNAIRAFVDENIDSRILSEYYESGAGMECIFGNLEDTNISQLLNKDTLKRVMNCIMQMNDKRVLNLTENSYIGLVMHISIAIKRILNQEIIEQDAPWMEDMEQDEDYFLAGRIVSELEQEFAVQIPPIEICYICLHIKGAKHQNIEWDEKKTMDMEQRELLTLVNEMINAYDSRLSYDLKQDDEFIQGLLAHLQPTFVRLMYHMKITNPVLEEIKRTYPEVFKRCLLVAAVLEKWIGKPVPEEETGFLAIHFGAAEVRLEGRKENIRQVKIGVVCASGIGISRLMSSKLEKIFKDRIAVTTYGKNDITPYIMGCIDFFVSSIPLPRMEACVIQVSSLLGEEDIDLIRRKVSYYERLPKPKEEDAFTLELEQVNLLALQIKTIIQHMNLFKVDNSIGFEELLIAIGEQVSPYRDRQELVREDIKKRESVGSQVFAEFGFALFHTRTRGVTRPVFLVCMTKDLQAFTDDYFKGITMVIIMLVPVDDHIRINSEILGFISSTLIEEYEFLETIAGGDKEEIKSVLSRYLKKFFNQYLNRLT